MDEWISRQHTLLVVVQESQLQSDQHNVVENRVAMGLKGSGPFFQRSMTNKVLAGYVTRLCEINIDDVLLFLHYG